MKLRRTTLIWMIFVASFVYLVYQIAHPPVVTWSPNCTTNDAFVQAIAARASVDRYIILALVDTGFVDMAINLYETSLRRNGIENFLFVGLGRRTCDQLHSYELARLPCFHYTDMEGSETASVYMSVDFLKKMNVRTDMIRDALEAGFTVVHTDLDVIFFRNPLPDIKVVMLQADMAALWDSVVYNAGFVIVRPTWYGKRLYEITQRITADKPLIDDQKALNYAVRRLERRYRTPRRSGLSVGEAGQFKAVALDAKRYVCGVDYFEKTNRLFPIELNSSDPSSSPSSMTSSFARETVIHNNWIVSREAKIYRFKEHLMWMYDKGGYYSSNVQKYLVYDNPRRTTWPTEFTSGDDDVVFGEQMNALRSALALGRLLERAVILPRFYCNVTSRTAPVPRPGANKAKLSTYLGGKRQPGRDVRSTTKAPPVKFNLTFIECPLNSLLNMVAFDSAFDGAYRESSFLRHPKVPEAVKTGIAGRRYDVAEVASFSSASTEETLPIVVTADEVLARLGPLTDKVLSLGQLYDVRPQFGSTLEINKFDKLSRTAFKRSNYRQL